MVLSISMCRSFSPYNSSIWVDTVPHYTGEKQRPRKINLLYVCTTNVWQSQDLNLGSPAPILPLAENTPSPSDHTSYTMSVHVNKGQ